MSERIGVLFVCLGNICRSPLAKAVFRAEVIDAGLDAHFDIDSAGTSGYHDGEGADPRTTETARRRGIEIDHISRKIHATDFERFDYIVVMDQDNLRNVERLRERAGAEGEIRLLRSYDPEAAEAEDVPDPYYSGASGFAEVHDIVERSCAALLASIRAERRL